MSSPPLPGLPPEARYALRPELGASELLERLATRFRLQVRESVEREVEYLDTPDWRLRRARLTLARGPRSGAHENGARELLLETDSGEVERARLTRSADFPWELPEGPLGERVREAARVRRLLPQVRVCVATSRLEVLDAREKIVARIDVLEGRALGAGEAPLPTTVRVEPLRGYEEERDAVVEFLEQAEGTETTAETTLEAAIRALGRDPRAERPAWRVELDPMAPAGVEVRRALERLLDNLRAAEPGVLDDVDTEYLHDFRVSVRRTRSILSHAKSVLSPDEREHFRGEFRWLGQATSPVRDLDVFLLAAHGRTGSLGGADPDQLVDLQRHLARRRRRAFARMSEVLRSARYHYLLESWQAFLEQPSVDDAPDAAKPVAHFAAGRIAKQHARVRKRARRLDPEGPSEPVHALRIECKKLRYLLDAFGGLFAVQPVARATKRLKQLQGALGDFNDAEVQGAMLRELAGQLKDPPVETLLTIGRAIERLAVRSAQLRPKLARRIDVFSREVNRAAVAALVGTARGMTSEAEPAGGGDET